MKFMGNYGRHKHWVTPSGSPATRVIQKIKYGYLFYFLVSVVKINRVV